MTWFVLIGFMLGVLGKLALPGPKDDPMGYILAIILGVFGSFVGSFLGPFLLAVVGLYVSGASERAMVPVLGAIGGALAALLLGRSTLRTRKQ